MPPSSIVLYETSIFALSSTHVDPSGRDAFSISAHRDPNTLIRGAREQPWALQHASDVRGARDAFVYLDYANQPVHVAFGAGERRPVKEWMRPVMNAKNKGNVKAFTSLSLGTTGGEYKWRVISAEKMESLKGNTVIATWERIGPLMSEKGSNASGPDAQLSLAFKALPIATEVLTTLTLNRLVSN